MLSYVSRAENIALVQISWRQLTIKNNILSKYSLELVKVVKNIKIVRASIFKSTQTTNC